MNKTKIDWADYSINPIKGMCKGTCEYCYAKKMYKRFKWNPEIRFDYSAFDGLENLKAGTKIFMGSTHDIFGSWISWDWIRCIILRAVQNPHLIFIFLTKNPELYTQFAFPQNAWLGYSTTGTLFHKWDERHSDNIKFVSLEPMQEAMNASLEGFAQKIDFDWLICGKESGNRKARIIPQDGWIEQTIEFARRAQIKLFLKNNLNYKLRIQEFPV